MTTNLRQAAVQGVSWQFTRCHTKTFGDERRKSSLLFCAAKVAGCRKVASSTIELSHWFQVESDLSYCRMKNCEENSVPQLLQVLNTLLVALMLPEQHNVAALRVF
jgi:hypothetical protein